MTTEPPIDGLKCILVILFLAGPGGTQTLADLGERWARLAGRIDAGQALISTRLEAMQQLHSEVPVSRWLEGATTAEVVVRTTSRVVKVEIDADQAFPDVDRSNNVWQRT